MSKLLALICVLATIPAYISGSNKTQNNVNGDAPDPYYDALPKSTNTSNFMSLSTKEFPNINGQTVTVDTFYRSADEALNNPNVGEGVLIAEAMEYKRQHPKEDVDIGISSFHFSVVASVCLDRESRFFGYMRSLFNEEYDQWGFYRISYLLVEAAKMGINTTIIGQINANPVSAYENEKIVTKNDYDFVQYFSSKMNEDCYDKYAHNKKVSDFLNFHKCKWTSYGDKAATDMMHTKICYVSDYVDNDSLEHHNAVYYSCTNLDAINHLAYNGNNGAQSGLIITNHKNIYTISYNYLSILSNYCNQEDSYYFRNLIKKMNYEQTISIMNGRPISENEQIIYLGSNFDNIFEAGFTPFGGNDNLWDKKFNPICRFVESLSNSFEYIDFAYVQPSDGYTNLPFYINLKEYLLKAFEHANSNQSKLFLHLYGDSLNEFIDLKDKKLASDVVIDSSLWTHAKDFFFSYRITNERNYVTLHNSLNLHGGSMSYQSNHWIAIKEKKNDSASIYHTLASLTTMNVII